ncbi:hypothetical protein F8M41_023979 [Gigaspora margarita]|uniref:Uncharacterized protein n=1 Tax=Gigaspora margarita TaxID=4874 RepID=A0A8H4EVT2_GIGMA|nr:hypothetical protein F8M41_023979 [Gigaspora margarita]
MIQTYRENNLLSVTEKPQPFSVNANENTFNTYELNDLELCFASNNDDGSNLFTEILDNNGQLITEEEDNIRQMMNLRKEQRIISRSTTSNL